ncbi:MAG: 50S ribosomal protein L25 [Tepidiformaceae bacterium]
MADRATIQAAPRAVLGKKVKQLRRQGILPANVYGKGLESLAIQLDNRDFTRTVRATGARGMFELAIEGEPAPRHVVLRGLSRKGGTGDPIHVDFYQVDLNRPIHTNVPLHIVGESPAVRDLAGTLVQTLEHVSVSCLPLSIPDAIEIDSSAITDFGITLTVGDLVTPDGVQILTDASVPVASVAPPRLRLEPGEVDEEAEEAAAAEEETPEPAE